MLRPDFWPKDLAVLLGLLLPLLLLWCVSQSKTNNKTNRKVLRPKRRAQDDTLLGLRSYFVTVRFLLRPHNPSINLKDQPKLPFPFRNQIAPLRVRRCYQRILLSPRPSFDLFLARNSSPHIAKFFVVNQPKRPILRRESLRMFSAAML